MLKEMLNMELKPNVTLTPSPRPCVSGLLQYSHEKGEKGGSLSFKFNLVDPEGNKLIDQSFFISVLGKVSSVLCYLQRSNDGSSVPSFGGEKEPITADLSLRPACPLMCICSPDSP